MVSGVQGEQAHQKSGGYDSGGEDVTGGKRSRRVGEEYQRRREAWRGDVVVVRRGSGNTL